MAEIKQMSDSEKLDDIRKRIKHIEVSGDIQTAINILIFVGIASAGILLSELAKLKKIKI